MKAKKAKKAKKPNKINKPKKSKKPEKTDKVIKAKVEENSTELPGWLYCALTRKQMSQAIVARALKMGSKDQLIEKHSTAAPLSQTAHDPCACCRARRGARWHSF
jgi:hypothetical protein